MKEQRKKHSRFHKKYVIEKELRHHAIEWGATVLSIAGAILNAKLIIDGFYASFYIWSAANILWLSFAFKHKHWGFFLTSLIYLIINAFAIIKMN